MPTPARFFINSNGTCAEQPLREHVPGIRRVDLPVEIEDVVTPAVRLTLTVDGASR